MDDFQSFGGFFSSKTDFAPPYPPISGHSVIAPIKFPLYTVVLCIGRQYWIFATYSHYLSWLMGTVCGEMMNGVYKRVSRMSVSISEHSQVIYQRVFFENQGDGSEA